MRLSYGAVWQQAYSEINNNRSFTVQGEIADRCEVVKMLEFVPQSVGLRLGAARLLVLYLQLDLMHLQFVNQR